MQNFLLIYKCFGFFKLLWIFFWFILILGVCLDLDFGLLFGLLIWYIITYPIYQRVDIFMESQKFLLNSNLHISLFILLILIILWIFVLIKILVKFPIPSPRLKKILNNFSRFWKLPQDLFVHLIIYEQSFVHSFVIFILENAEKYLNTNKKKLWFFFIPLFLPKILSFLAISYDLYEKQFIWSPIVGLLLIIPIITKICFGILEHYSNEFLDEVLSYVYFERKEKTDEQEKLITEALGPGKYGISEIVFRRPCKQGIEDVNLNFFLDCFFKYSYFRDWCLETRILLHKISNYMFLVFLTFAIIIKLYEIILIY